MCDTGWAVSAFFGYLKGVQNELALKHIPHVKPRNDTLAGPVGRMGDMVSWSLSRRELQQAAAAHPSDDHSFSFNSSPCCTADGLSCGTCLSCD